MVGQRTCGMGILVVGFLVVVVIVASAQGQRNPATLDDLLAELRGLRAEMSQTTSAGIRAQLLVGRLQLEEQRITTLSAQLITIRQQLTALERGLETVSGNLKQLEGSVADALTGTDERKSLDRMISDTRITFEDMQREVQRARSQEAELVGILGSEQAQWGTFNGRLDELERSLPPVTPR